MSDQHGDGGRGPEAPALDELIEAVASHAQGYLTAQQTLIKLDISERGGRVAAKTVWYIAAILLVSIGIGLLAVALGLYLGRVFHDAVLGFLAAGGVFFLSTALFYLLWRWVLRDRIILAVINAAHAKPDNLP
jgi:hypothetical protein